MNLLKCDFCPRKCGINRVKGERGFCRMGSEMYISRAGLHFYEEPFISGKEGSGTLFFSGCNMNCVYCQNYKISRGEVGKKVSEEELAESMLDLQKKGANNINLVTPTHFIGQIIKSVKIAKNKGLFIPIVYNTSGYEDEDSLKALEHVVDIYLTDFRYMEDHLAEQFSACPNYPRAAKAALQEMVRQQPECITDERGMLKKGVVVRILLLPGHVKNSKEVLQYVYDTYGEQVLISLMNQFTPVQEVQDFEELNRKVTKREYERLLSYALELGVTNAFIQEGDTARESFIPDFELLDC